MVILLLWVMIGGGAGVAANRLSPLPFRRSWITDIAIGGFGAAVIGIMLCLTFSAAQVNEPRILPAASWGVVIYSLLYLIIVAVGREP